MSKTMLNPLMNTARDDRIDFFRGLALLAILANHIDLLNGTWHFRFSLKWLYPGFSDAAEVFVFLSGFVYGMVYFRHLLRNSLPRTYIKTLHRVSQLYVMNALVLVVVLAIVGLFKSQINPDMALPGSTGLFYVDPATTSWLAALWIYQPMLFIVLPLYMVLLLMAPLALGLARKSLLLPLGISFAVYLAVQFVPAINLPAYPFETGVAYPWGEGWAFNPFAWQFLFFLGVFMALGLKQGKLSIPRNRTLLLISVAILLLALWPRTHFVLGKLGMVDAQWFHVPWLDKRNLEPLRLVHFFALGYVVYRALPRGHWVYRTRLARPVTWCGQYSLEIFALGIVLTYLAYGVLSVIGLNALNLHIVTFLALAFTLAWGAMLHGKKRVLSTNLADRPFSAGDGVPLPQPASA